MKILFIGDVVGRTGRSALKAGLPELRERHQPDFVIVNGENAAKGHGISPRLADEMLNSGVDVITLGNHAYRQREVFSYLDEQERIIRPCNYLEQQPGRGWCIVSSEGARLAVINLAGNTFMQTPLPAFYVIDKIVNEVAGKVDHILVDFHAEATSEKVALGWHLDGRVTAVVGTHTHVPTGDARILPKGTAYISDVGMTGARGGVLGMRRDQVLGNLLTQMPARFEESTEDPWVMGVLVTVCERLRASAVEPIQLSVPV